MTVSAAGAAIVATTGAVVHVAPPPSVLQETYTSDSDIRAFEERQDFVAPVPIAVDISRPGVYNSSDDLTPATIPAGTCVESHFLHFDNVSLTALVRLQGSVTFDADVLGVVIRFPTLNQSDPLLGSPGTLYPTGDAGREVELDPGPTYREVVTLSQDVRTVTVDLVVGNAYDQLRVITACGVNPPAALALTPVAATNPVGTQHCVTAVVTDASGAPTPDIIVRFAVTGSVTTAGTGTTDQDGQAQFCYTGPQLPGADLITAYADTDDDDSQDPGEPAGAATKAWVLPATTPGQVTGGGQIAAVTSGGKITFGFNAQNTDKGLKGTCTVIDQTTETKIKCLDVTALVQVGTHATFFGRAEVNGVPTTYRIDVDDLGEPGTGRDTFKIQTDSGYVAGGVLTQGNIQIHRP